MTECKQEVFGFQGHHGRKVTVDFNGGHLSSDGGLLFVREVVNKRGIVEKLARCFTDLRFAPFVEHSVEELLGQRIGALALGYEDLNDHDRLRHDPLCALMAGKRDVLGEERPRVEDIRRRFGRKVRIIVRADSGFAREEIMSWCEENGVYYCLGLARNKRLVARMGKAFGQLEEEVASGGSALPCRRFEEFEYRTRKSWSRSRRVVGKAEVLEKGRNPRFIVTNLEEGWDRRFARAALYEGFYCGPQFEVMFTGFLAFGQIAGEQCGLGQGSGNQGRDRGESPAYSGSYIGLSPCPFNHKKPGLWHGLWDFWPLAHNSALRPGEPGGKLCG